ncbi:hypothetical protein A2U01_0047179, partial [Trifolium medium]|nr:hypothetical protein [Trifolium medium]
KKETGVDVPRSMVPPAPNVDLYKPRKRKRTVKTSEDEPKKKEMKKEKVTASEKQKETVVEKEKVIVAEREKIVAAEVDKRKKDKKRKSAEVKAENIISICQGDASEVLKR